MKLFSKGKDGGYESTVTGYWLCEFKNWFSVVLLRFDNGSREAYHDHAFNSVSWLLWGKLTEHFFPNYELGGFKIHYPGFTPIVTNRDTFHKVYSIGTSWVLSFRGPWAKEWHEFLPETQEQITLTNGREQVWPQSKRNR